MLEILNNNKESNLNNIDFFKSLPLSSYNFYSPYKFCSTQTARAIMLDININERLPIQVLLVNKQYTPKTSTQENIKEARQRIYTHIQNIKGSFSILHNLLYALYIKQNYKCRIYKQNFGPYFKGIYLRCRLSNRSCDKVYTNNILIILLANMYIGQFIKARAGYTSAQKIYAISFYQ